MTTGESINLEVNVRETGKGNSHKLRKKFLTPAVVYGSKLENTNVALEEKWIVKYSKLDYENAIFVLKSSESKVNNRKVLMKKVDRDPVSRRPIHVDFYALDMTQEVRVNIELTFEGKAEGLLEGGQLQPIRRSVEVDCLPDKIPDTIVVDVTPLKLNDTLHLSDLNFPEGVKQTSKEDLAIVTVAEIREEEEAPVAEAAAEGAVEGEAAAEGAAAPKEGGAAEKKAEGEKKD